MTSVRDKKFRGKSIDTDEWVQGSLIAPPDSLDDHTYIRNVGNIRGERHVMLYAVDPETVGQLTSMKDKKGADIYEGDILDDGGVIEFRDDLNWDSGGSVHSGFFSTKGYEYKEDGCLAYHYQISEHEVVGNVSDNPELVGKPL